MESFFRTIASMDFEQSDIHIISVDFTSFKRYLDIAKVLNIKTAIIRDNDGDYQANCVYNYSDYSGFYFFFFNDTATTEIYTLSLHDALPILGEDGHGHETKNHGFYGAKNQEGGADNHRINIQQHPSQGDVAVLVDDEGNDVGAAGAAPVQKNNAAAGPRQDGPGYRGHEAVAHQGLLDVITDERQQGGKYSYGVNTFYAKGRSDDAHGQDDEDDIHAQRHNPNI